MRVTQLLIETEEGIKNNSLSYDQFTQNISNATAVQAAAYLELRDAEEQLNKFKATQSGFREGSAMWDLVAAEEARFAAAKASYDANNRILESNKSMTDEYRKQKELQEYLLSITSKQLSDIDLGAKIAAAGSGNELQTQIQYSYEVVKANAAAIKSLGPKGIWLKTSINETKEPSKAITTTRTLRIIQRPIFSRE
jgi:hypothetical protein